MKAYVIEADGKFWGSNNVWNGLPDLYPEIAAAEKVLKRNSPLIHAEYHDINPCDIKIVEYTLVPA